MTQPTHRITFICMGNICRSPTAHGVFRHKLSQAGLAERVSVDSAGTHDYHGGEPPDPRSQRHAQRRGYDLSDLRARPLAESDFERSDLVLVMDAANFANAMRRCPPALQHKVRRLTEFCRVHDRNAVPDPYSGGDAGFEFVLDLIEDACDGLIEHVRAQLKA